MAKRKNRHIGRSLGELIDDQRRRDPEFALEWDKRLLARHLRALRENKQLTQGALAARAGTTQSAIARLESGKVIPKLDLLQRIATAMGFRLTLEFSSLRGSSREPLRGAA